MYIKKCIELNKHNHFTTSYYLLLRKCEEANRGMETQISEDIEKRGRETNYVPDHKSSVRGNSVKIKDTNKIDPFAHLTPVARRFIESKNIVTTSKAYSQNPQQRMNSSDKTSQKRNPAKINQNYIFNIDDNSFSPQKSNFQSTTNNYKKFTSTVMGSFRPKGGYSAPEQKRNIGYETSHGPFFNSRVPGETKNLEKKSFPYNLKVKPQLPNVSKQRVQIKSNNERYNRSQNMVYPSSI